MIYLRAVLLQYGKGCPQSYAEAADLYFEILEQLQFWIFDKHSLKRLSRLVKDNVNQHCVDCFNDYLKYIHSYQDVLNLSSIIDSFDADCLNTTAKAFKIQGKDFIAAELYERAGEISKAEESLLSYIYNHKFSQDSIVCLNKLVCWNSLEGTFILGLLNLHGVYVEKNMMLAHRLFSQCAQQRISQICEADKESFKRIRIQIVDQSFFYLAFIEFLLSKTYKGCSSSLDYITNNFISNTFLSCHNVIYYKQKSITDIDNTWDNVREQLEKKALTQDYMSWIEDEAYYTDDSGSGLEKFSRQFLNFDLAVMYEYGILVNKNHDKAVEYANKTKDSLLANSVLQSPVIDEILKDQ